MNIRIPLAILLASLSLPASAIQKCVQPDGKVVFQDVPCTSGPGETIKVRPTSGLGQPTPAREPVRTALPAPAPVEAPAPAPVAARAVSPLEAEAEMCLDWYRELLRDPAGAYYRNPRKEKRVLSMEIHATNGFGGYVIKTAACEIHNGKLNSAYTKNHARWGGWNVN